MAVHGRDDGRRGGAAAARAEKEACCAGELGAHGPNRGQGLGFTLCIEELRLQPHGMTDVTVANA